MHYVRSHLTRPTRPPLYTDGSLRSPLLFLPHCRPSFMGPLLSFSDVLILMQLALKNSYGIGSRGGSDGRILRASVAVVGNVGGGRGFTE